MCLVFIITHLKSTVYYSDDAGQQINKKKEKELTLQCWWPQSDRRLAMVEGIDQLEDPRSIAIPVV